jgi:hypothetical protein
MEDIFEGLGIEVSLPSPGSFLSITETLTRIGVSSKDNNKLYQSCHILHKRGRYAIMSFKELLVLDGKTNTITDNDIARRNTIAKLLQDWNLLTIIDNMDKFPIVPVSQLKIITYKEKDNYELISKYHFGTAKYTRGN